MADKFSTVLRRAVAQGVRHKIGTPASTLPDRTIRKTVHADPVKAAEFAHLMGDEVRTYLHPGYVHTLGFPLTMSLLTEKDFPLPLLGMVHISNTITSLKPIRIDDELEIEASIDGARPHYAGTLLDSMIRVSVGGEEVYSSHSEYLVRGSDFGGERPERPQREEFVAPRATAQWKLDGRAGRTYAAVSGDSNPIHLTKLTAKVFGFDRPIVHGMYSASRAFSATATDLEKPFEWFVGFDAPIKLPGTVEFAVSKENGSAHYVGWRRGRGEKPARRHFHGYVTTH